MSNFYDNILTAENDISTEDWTSGFVGFKKR